MRPNLAALRSTVGPLLTETGTLYRKTGRTITDPVTGRPTQEWTVAWTGPMLVRPEPAVEVSVGGIKRIAGRFAVTLPHDAEASNGDVLIVEDSPDAPDFAGLRINLDDVPVDAWVVARFCAGQQTSTTPYVPA